MERPELRGLPVVVSHPGAPTVWDASPAARASGIHPGQSLRHARALCPLIAVIDGRPSHYRAVSDQLLMALETVVSAVEPQMNGGDSLVYLDVRGLERHHRSPAALADALLARVPVGLAARLGMASQKFAALVAAHMAPVQQWRVVDAIQTRKLLAIQSVEMLPASVEVLARLRLLGIDTLGHLARLSKRKVTAEFGFDGTHLWRLAAGEDDESLRPRLSQARVQEEMAFEPPLTSREQLLVALHHLLGRVVQQPGVRGRAVRQTTVTMRTEHGDVWERTTTFKEAVAEPRTLHRLLTQTLADAQTRGAVVSLNITLSDLSMARGWQRQLPIARGGLQEQLDEALRQLRTRYGSSRIFSIVAQETWSPFPEDHYALVERSP